MWMEETNHFNRGGTVCRGFIYIINEGDIFFQFSESGSHLVWQTIYKAMRQTKERMMHLFNSDKRGFSIKGNRLQAPTSKARRATS